MSDFIIKGIACGFDNKEYYEDQTLFPSILISVIHTWISITYDTQGNLKIETDEYTKREYGRIKAAYYALDNDIHNLAVNYHLLSRIISDSKLDVGFKSLYVSLLVENYITNLRSIYDSTSLLPRILVDPKDFKKLSIGKNSDSLNSLVNYIKKTVETNNQLYPLSINETILDCGDDLENIRKIRDAIIHHGKEPIIEIENNKVYFRIPQKPPYGKENCLPDILFLGKENNYPLKKYLRTLTIKLLNYMEQLGNVIGQEFYNKNNNYKVELTALIGICMKDFMEFLSSEET